MKKLLILLFFGISSSAFSQNYIVSQSGNGDFKTIQEALNVVSIINKKPIIIYIKNGIYKEKLHLDSTKSKVTLIGEDKFKTILTYDDYTGKLDEKGKSINTRSSYTFLIAADDFSAINIGNMPTITRF